MMMSRDSSVGKTARGPNPDRDEIFHTHPDLPWGLPSFLYNGYRVCFPGVKRPGRGVEHPPTSSADDKERVELYFCYRSGPSWPVLGRIWWVCACSLSYPACKGHAPFYIVICGLFYILPHYLINGKSFGKRLLYFFVFCTTFVRNVSHFTKNSARYVGLHAQYPLFLSHFNES